jgi:CBS domain-containing protein
MKLRDLMIKNVITVSPDGTITAAAQIMRVHRIGCLVVTADGLVRGILTDRDLLTCLAAAHDPQDCTVTIHMTASVAVDRPDEELIRAAEKMAQMQIKRLPIIEDNRLVGLISFSDIADLVSEQWQEVWWTLAPLTRYIRAQSVHRRGREPRPVKSELPAST